MSAPGAAVVALDGRGLVVFADRVAHDLYVEPGAALLGRPLAALAGPHWLGAPDADGALQSLEAHGRWSGRVEHHTRAGLLPVAVDARQWLDGRGAVGGVQLTIRFDAGGAAAPVPVVDAVRSDLEAVAAGPRFGALLSMVGWLLSARTVEEVGAAACGAVLGALGGSGGHLAVRRVDGTAAYASATGYSAEAMRSWGTIDLAVDTPVRAALVEGREVYLGDVTARDTAFPALRDVGGDNQAWCTVPVVAGGRVLASLGCSFPEPRSFDEADRALLRVAAHATAIALRRTQGDGPAGPAPVRRARVRVEVEWSADIGLAGVRRVVQAHLAMVGVDHGDVLLCLSELLTNAVRHGLAPIGLVVEAGADGVRIEVRDCSPDLPRRRLPDATGGRGLHIVASVARRWGTEPAPWGKTIWADVAPGAPAAAG